MGQAYDGSWLEVDDFSIKLIADNDITTFARCIVPVERIINFADQLNIIIIGDSDSG